MNWKTLLSFHYHRLCKIDNNKDTVFFYIPKCSLRWVLKNNSLMSMTHSLSFFYPSFLLWVEKKRWMSFGHKWIVYRESPLGMKVNCTIITKAFIYMYLYNVHLKNLNVLLINFLVIRTIITFCSVCSYHQGRHGSQVFYLHFPTRDNHFCTVYVK